MAYLISEEFHLPSFFEAVEVLYLALGSDLCHLRSKVNSQVLDFFQEVYKKPAIHRFLDNLVFIEGAELNNIHEKAFIAYRQLLKLYNKFISGDYKWGITEKASIPLYKLVFSNLYRLERISMRIKSIPSFVDAGKDLEEKAENITNSFLNEINSSLE